MQCSCKFLICLVSVLFIVCYRLSVNEDYQIIKNSDNFVAFSAIWIPLAPMVGGTKTLPIPKFQNFRDLVPHYLHGSCTMSMVAGDAGVARRPVAAVRRRTGQLGDRSGDSRTRRHRQETMGD